MLFIAHDLNELDSNKYVTPTRIFVNVHVLMSDCKSVYLSPLSIIFVHRPKQITVLTNLYVMHERKSK